MRSSVPTLVLLSVALAGAGCDDEGFHSPSFYEERIEPVLESSCARQTAGCHVDDGTGRASGNLDLSSYDALMRRRDALPPYGPYPLGLLLMKVSGPRDVRVDTLDPPDPAEPDVRQVVVTTDIRHNAGSGIGLSSSAFAEIQRWVDAGYTRSGVPREEERDEGGPCVPGAGDAPGFDPEAEPVDAQAFDAFVEDVQPVLRERCASSSCHGAQLADLRLSCGDTEEEKRWNFWITVQHLDDPAERSELLQRPLAASRGGAFHGGGDTFESPDDADYQTLRGWAADLLTRRPELVRPDDVSEGFRFFANRVQPTLVRKGCMFLNCHSPISLKMNLRGGSQGAFSRYALERNYGIARGLLALESPDPNQSRIVAKNLYTSDEVSGADGIAHRGGSLFEDFGASSGGLVSADPSLCDEYDADGGDLNEVPAYCVLARWHRIERDEAVARGEVLPDAQPVNAVVWVARPPGIGPPDGFDAYRPGADLRIADPGWDADGRLSVSGTRSLLGPCGLDPSTADVRGPASSWDGTEIAFAARSSGEAPLRLYRTDLDGTSCERIPGVADEAERVDGVLTHDFDPAYAPDGRIVFASTRSGTRAPASMGPNADLYVYEPGRTPAVRQLTFLPDQELAPAFMADGRVLFTAEKRAPGFHQLALRRQNLDGGDYHPLYAQRPTVGFEVATEGVHLPNLNFAFAGSFLDATDGAGAIALANRSIGPDQVDRDPDERGYIPSMRVPGEGAGVFRSPAALPSGRVLAACDRSAGDPAEGPFDFDLCVVDPSTGGVRTLAGEPGLAEVEPVAVYARPDRGVLRSDGGGIDRPEIVAGAEDAVVHYNDFPIIASLMFENTRTGRPIDPRIGGFEVLEVLAPPPEARGFDDVRGRVVEDEYGRLFVERRSLGWVPLEADGSTKMRVPGGTPLSLRLTDETGQPLLFPEESPHEGEMVQRECEQYYPGERIQRSIPRRFFNAVCGGCHGSITGRELDIAVDLDVVSGASENQARDAAPVNLY